MCSNTCKMGQKSTHQLGSVQDKAQKFIPNNLWEGGEILIHRKGSAGTGLAGYGCMQGSQWGRNMVPLRICPAWPVLAPCSGTFPAADPVSAVCTGCSCVHVTGTQRQLLWCSALGPSPATGTDSGCSRRAVPGSQQPWEQASANEGQRVDWKAMSSLGGTTPEYTFLQMLPTGLSLRCSLLWLITCSQMLSTLASFTSCLTSLHSYRCLLGSPLK